MKVTNIRVVSGSTLGLPPEGSPEWVRLKVEALRFHGNQSQYNGEKAARSARWLREHPAAWYDPDNELHRFADWGEFVESVCELEPGWADFLVEHEARLTGDYQADRRTAAVALAEKAEPGPTHKDAGAKGGRGNKAADNVSSFSHGNAADYLTRRIARDRPDILERMKAGEFRSVRQAALEAGIVKPRWSAPVDIDALAAALLRRYSSDELTALKRWVTSYERR